MRSLVPGLAALLFAALVLVPAAGGPARAAAGPVPLGPGGVYSLHVQLFRAIDAGDEAGVRKLLGGRERGLVVEADSAWAEHGRAFDLFLLDGDGKPARAGDVDAAVELLAAPEDEAGAWTTRIVDGWLDCPSGDVSFATLVFERTRTQGDAVETRRFRSTSLVSYEDGGWTLWHLHVSPAG